MGLLYLIPAALYGVASYYLLAYSLRIGELARQPAVSRLDKALIAQKSFWKFAGICTAVVIALYIMMFIIMFAMVGFQSF